MPLRRSSTAPRSAVRCERSLQSPTTGLARRTRRSFPGPVAGGGGERQRTELRQTPRRRRRQMPRPSARSGWRTMSRATRRRPAASRGRPRREALRRAARWRPPRCPRRRSAGTRTGGPHWRHTPGPRTGTPQTAAAWRTRQARIAQGPCSSRDRPRSGLRASAPRRTSRQRRERCPCRASSRCSRGIG